MAQSGLARLVVWGGSAVGTPVLIKTLRSRLLPEERLDVVLVGRTASRLEVVGELCRKLAGVCKGDLRVSYTSDIVGSLEGANYILNQVRVGGLSGRLFDETFPRDLGIPGEETVGPGGFSCALRTVPVILEYCRLAEQKAPHALILNLANPSSYVQYAIRRYTSMAAVGICDTPVRVTRRIAGVLGISYAELDFDYVGMHHAGWVTGVRYLGRDILPQVLEQAEQVEAGVDPSVIRAVGAIPSPYFRYYFHPDRVLAEAQGKKCRAEELIDKQAELLAEYAQPDAHERSDIGAQRGAAWYDMIVVPVLLSLLRDSRKHFIVNIDNGSTIPWLPSEAIAEVPCVIGASGAQPLHVGAVPADVRAWLQCNCTYEMLAVQAIVERSYDLAMRALLLNPLISSLDVARAVLDRVWTEDRAH